MDFALNVSKKGGGSRKGNKNGKDRDRKKKEKGQNIYSSKHVRISTLKIERAKEKDRENSTVYK